MICFLLDTFMVRPAVFLLTSFILTMLFFVCPAYNFAGEFRLVPSVKVQEEYDDNIFYSAREVALRDIVSTFTPGVELKVDNPRIVASLKGSVAGIAYGDREDLNAVDQFLTSGLTYMLTQRLRSTVNLNYTRDSQPNRDLAATGLPIYSAAARERQRYNVAGDYSFSEKTSLNFSYGFSRDRYSDNSLSGYLSHSCGFGLQHDLGQYVPELIGRMNFNFMRYDYPSIDVENTTISLGASWKYSEKVTLSGDLWPRFTITNYEVPVTIFDFPPRRFRTETKDGQGMGGRFSYAYQGLLTSWNLFASRELDQASGRNGATERTTTGLDISRSLTDEVSLGLHCAYYENKSDKGELASQDLDTSTILAQPRVKYKVNQNLELLASFSYWEMHENPSEIDKIKKQVLVELRYEYPFFD